MKRGLLILSVILVGCQSEVKPPSVIDEDVHIVSEGMDKVETDTLIEKNHPEFLDFSKHQVFIDTSRDSRFYDEITNWTPSFSDSGGVDSYLSEIGEEFDLATLDLNEFPREWIAVHRLADDFVVHNPLNGIDLRIRMTDSSINNYAMESDAHGFHKIISFSEGELILELRTIKNYSENQVYFTRFTRTNIPHTYKVQFSSSLKFNDTDRISLFTPLKKIRNFDLVVDSSPQLIASFVRFDNIMQLDIDKLVGDLKDN
jgi:hypothetical protein